jgi:hypothetical protein
MDGVIIGNFILTDGDLIDFDGEIDPCPEDEVVEEEEDDSNDSSTGGGSSNTSDPNNNTDNDSSNGSTGGNGEIGDPDQDDPCGFEITYQPCCNGASCDANSDGHGEEECGGCGNGSPTTITNTCTGDSVTYTYARTIMGNSSPCDGPTGVLLPLDDCEVSNETFNSIYSNNSPFNVDLSSVREDCNEVGIDTSLVSANAKFMCIYNKLVNSPKFKDLFIDTFGESENLDITFKISDTLSTNARTRGISMNINPTTNEVLSADLEILISKDYMGSASAIAVAKTILHECIHTYLILKKYSCEQAIPFENMGNQELSETLNEYFNECAPSQADHEFMFNFMIPTMSEILADLKDDLIPLSHQQNAETRMYINEENPTTDDFGNIIRDVPWSWNEFYKNLSLVGLQDSSAFHLEYGVQLPISEQTYKYQNYYDYGVEIGTNSFRDECVN